MLLVLGQISSVSGFFGKINWFLKKDSPGLWYPDQKVSEGTVSASADTVCRVTGVWLSFTKCPLCIKPPILIPETVACIR